MTDYTSLADQAAIANGVPTDLFRSLVNVESNWNPFAISPKGATGLSQIMPSNFASLEITNPFDPTQNLNGGAKLLSQMFKSSGNWYDAARQYNQGNIAITDSTKGVAYADKVFKGANMTNTQTTGGSSGSWDQAKNVPNSGVSFWSDPVQYLTDFLKSSAWFVGGVLVVLVLLYFGVQQLIKE